MTAWPMIARCLENQWRGYAPEVRDLMIAEWKLRNGAPGIVGNTGHHSFVIWRVEQDGRSHNSPSDMLMSIKVDLGPSLLDTKTLTVVGSD